MTTVYFIRHAQTEGNVNHVVQGNFETAVTAEGHEQIAALGTRFADIPVDAVYSSDLHRAVETAEAISVPKGLPVRIDKAFREVDFGIWEGRKISDVTQSDFKSFDAFLHRLDQWEVEGGETAQQALDRFLPSLDRVLAENEGKTVAIVSHGCILRIVMAYLRGLTMEEVGDFIPCVNTAVSMVTWENNAPTVVYQDDGSHVGQTEAKKDWWKE